MESLEGEATTKTKENHELTHGPELIPEERGLFTSVIARVRTGWNRKLADKFQRWETISPWWSLCFIGFVIIVYFIGYLLFNALPTPLYIKDEPYNQNRFISERARQYMKLLTDIGPKVTGSLENEVYAVNILKSIVSEINATRHTTHEIEIDVQKATGQFFLEFKPYGMMSSYNGIQNFIVKLKPAGRVAEHSLLVNSHFDSVPISPGAGDPIALVAVMLESLRVISMSPDALKHNIIFLFNGAEENTLQGSHAFITQHKWAKDVRAFVNLDSAGNGGKEIMFQAGPKHPWLMKYYQKSAKYPFAAVMGEELFQANIIPSDTDFRIFRDFGDIPGMDFAYSKNGYVYHTKYDTLDIHPNGTLQNTGDNIMELIKALGNADELENVNEHEDGKLVFFDFMTWFLIYYTQGIGILINCLIIVASLCVFAGAAYMITRNNGLTKREVLRELVFSTIVQIVSLGCGIGLTFLMAVIVDGIGRSLCWFSQPWLVFGLYFSPLYFAISLGPIVFIKYRKRAILPLAKHVQLFLHAQCIIIIVVLLLLTALKVRSAYIALFAIIFYTFSVMINTVIVHFQKKGVTWIIVHLICQIIPIMYFTELCSFSFATFMPMQGRSGPNANPELLIALFCILYGILLGGFIAPLFAMCRKAEVIATGFFALTILALILCATPIGFPYKSETNPQRYWIFHSNRVLHNADGSVKTADSGFFMLAMDRHSPDRVRDDVQSLSKAVSIADECDREIFCGMPFYTSRMHKQAEHSHWVPADSNNLDMPKMIHVSTDIISGRVKRFTFSFSGPDHLGIYFSPYHGIKLINWSVDTSVPDNVGPTYNNRKTYFIFYSYGLDVVDKDYNLTLDFEYPPNYTNGPTLEIALTSQYTHYDNNQTLEFQSFIKSFPKWTHVTPWMSTFENWRI